ncbi:PREDICTED: uncharacterized protein LOC107880235 [Prunus mume]|uniref:Uncharacterized protein LOC107880235 n=1 Tax=Prunus mume TaxID=102107 RepID=A0ABM1LHK3_PRUMU|nr:PREDICTED: uncharacterized protein LOC107880235 [Prunus mume]
MDGIKLSRGGPTLSHLFIADDSLVFLRTTNQKCRSFLNLLDGYCTPSGQQVNYSKSSIYLSPNASPELEAEIGVALRINPTTDPGVSLGIPAIRGISKKDARGYICDKIQKMVHGCKASSLTMAGREVLIKSVPLAIPAYLLSCVKFLSSTCKAINGDWGSHDDGGNKIYWKSWEHLCLSKSDAGMGFRDIETFNVAVLAKQCWILWNNPYAIWAVIVKSCYYWAFSSLGKKSLPAHSSHQIDTHVWKTTWKIDVVPKIRNFLWRVVSNAMIHPYQI